MDIGLIVIVIIFVTFIYLYGFKEQKDPQASAKIEIDRLNEELSLFRERWQIDEEPTVATVSDLSKLKDQEFFIGAKVGDKVIVYSKAGKVVLYSSEENLIINVAPLATTSNTNFGVQGER